MTAAPLEKSARHLLSELAAGPVTVAAQNAGTESRNVAVAALLSAGLAAQVEGSLQITAAGRAHLRRAAIARSGAPADAFRAQHLALVQAEIRTPEGKASVTLDEAESPIAWLARRKGRNGKAMVAPHQLQAAERLRAVFTRSQLMPRTTANWDTTAAARRGAQAPANLAEIVVTARQHLRQTLAAMGPEFSGLLLDVCCFLKRLEDVERDRGWPARSAKVVLLLALDRLARHYGLAPQARGRDRAAVRTWLDSDAAFRVEQFE